MITADRLSVRYGSRYALRDVSLRAERARLTALVGPSGCGKSTFLTCFNRLTDLVPGCRVTGRALIGSQDVLSARCDVIALRRRVGMIFQQPNPLPFSIRKNLEYPLAQHGVRDRAERAAISERALQDVGLWDEVKDRLSSSALALSGGQQQRLCIARALALSPEVILLDEPTSALDPISSGVIEDLIRNLRAEYTVVMVTHNLAQARRLADRVAVFWMEDGSGVLVEEGPTERIFTTPESPITRAYVSGAKG